ncbi:MAG: CPBP family intramembrane metalloprotease [Parvibaculum sp.]|nr:CPBP family intramembrane metalloprotease [Parvibaculum sp.]
MSQKPVWGVPPENPAPLYDTPDASVPNETHSPIRLRDAAFVVILYIGGQLIAAALYLFVVGFYWGFRQDRDVAAHVQAAQTSSAFLVFTIVFSIVLVALFARRVARRSGMGWRALGFVRPQRYWFAFAFAAFVLVNAVAFGLEYLAGPDVAKRAEQTMDIFVAGDEFYIWPMVALVAVIVPFFEEIVFRAILFRALSNRLPLIVAGAVAIAVFGVVHLQYLMSGLDVAVLMMTEIALIGGVLIWLYQASRSIWPSVFLHVLNNSWVMAILFMRAAMPA